MLSLPISCERFKPVCRRRPQIAQIASVMEHVELPQRLLFDAAEPFDERAHPEPLGRTVAKRPDHGADVDRLALYVKRITSPAHEVLSPISLRSRQRARLPRRSPQGEGGP